MSITISREGIWLAHMQDGDYASDSHVTLKAVESYGNTSLFSGDNVDCCTIATQCLVFVDAYFEQDCSILAER